MKNKKMLLSAFTIGTAFTLAACGGDSDTDPTMDEPAPDPGLEEQAPDENGNMEDPADPGLEPDEPGEGLDE